MMHDKAVIWTLYCICKTRSYTTKMYGVKLTTICNIRTWTKFKKKRKQDGGNKIKNTIEVNMEE